MQGSNFDRAKQFLPFDALNGFREELYKRENKVQRIEKIELCGESLDKLENKFSRVKVGKKVEGIFFKDGKYLKFKGTPESTLIMLVPAFSTRENILNAYEIAVREKYRFFSYGDAMLIK